MLPEVPEHALDTVVAFLKESIGDKKAVLGVSGGIDSTLVLYILRGVLPPERIIAVHMPESATPPKDTEDVSEICKELGIEPMVVNIEPAVKELAGMLGVEKDDLGTLGNVKARVRMTVLYGMANMENGIVVGTGNKTEIMIGYFTKYGDGGCDIEPIGDLYKAQVRALAKKLGVPDGIINKKPSAALWEGQTDEDDIGMSYETLDAILYAIERGFTDDEIADKLGVTKEDVSKVWTLIRNSHHKRHSPVIPKIGLKTPLIDWKI